MTDGGRDADLAALDSYLAAELDERAIETEVVHDGLNLSVAVSTAERENAYVVRRPRAMRQTELFNDLRSEYRLLERLRETALPTPDPVLFCDDPSILGAPFFVATYLDGTYVPMDDPLTDRFPTERARTGLARGVFDAMADLHTLDVERFEDVCDRRTPGYEIDREVDRLDRAERVTGRDCSDLREVAKWLRANVPRDPETALVHGDFKPGNLLISGSDEPTVTGVLDWETASLADPRRELGYLLLYWRDEGDQMPPIDEIEASYPDSPGVEDVRSIREDGFYPFTTLPGSPSKRELVDRYESRTGIAFEHDRFYRAHAALGLAAVWEDLHRIQVEAGAGPNSAYEPLADYVTLIAARIVDGEFPL